MANLSSFPNQIDAFTLKTEIQASDVPLIQRFQELKLKSSRIPSEETELANLTNQLRSKLIAADEWNKFQDALVNMEQFLTTNITGYVATKQNEINATKDAALTLIEQKKNNIIAYMDGTTAGAIRNDMGDLTTLTTTDKTSLVNAIKEVKANIEILYWMGV
ncbi:hypothetical protein [Paenibacillus ferrarius]|uniref:hypothetical protein n=1 Tax=Paenibacillus ferrarius TaxID=1469647 RepID=UPI001FCA0CB1|nr:hypothetical protein [Paenibacillus ferrarius]